MSADDHEALMKGEISAAEYVGRVKARGEFPEIASGEWVQPKRRGYLMKCCGCGLVHRINFRLVRRGNGRVIQLQAFLQDEEEVE
jgi:hypothetical protein